MRAARRGAATLLAAAALGAPASRPAAGQEAARAMRVVVEQLASRAEADPAIVRAALLCEGGDAPLLRVTVFALPPRRGPS